MRQTHRRTPMRKRDPNRIAMRLYWSHTPTGMLPCQSPSSPQNTPSEEHFNRAASVFYLKLIIQINQQNLSYARNFYKFYMDSFQVSIF